MNTPPDISELDPSQWRPVTLRVGDAVALAVQLHQAARLEEAEQIYRKVLQLVPDQVDALHFLGVLLHQLGRSAEAVELIGRAVALSPDYCDAHSNLGNVLQELGRFQEAEAAYRRVIALRPDHADAQTNLGIVLKRLGRPDEALDACQRAVSANPKHADAWHNLAGMLRLHERHSEAESAYREAIALRPEHTAAWHNLSKELYRAGNRAGAVRTVRQWLSVDPENPIARHLLGAYGGEDPPERASDEYVRKIFDSFAGSFNLVLQQLDYRAPRLIGEAIAEHLPAPAAQWTVLDAGCGTGLCGELLRPYARRLVGVDLSMEMLRRAREPGVYDALLQAELTAYLSGCSGAYDLIASADTLCYFGSLQPLVTAAAGALRPGGWLTFTVEDAADDEPAAGFRLQSHGRYCHASGYVRRTLSEAGFEIEALTSAMLRTEGRQPVAGLVVFASSPGGTGRPESKAVPVAERHGQPGVRKSAPPAAGQVGSPSADAWNDTELLPAHW